MAKVKRTQMSIPEQRRLLPIYDFKDRLIKAMNDNQILIVVGETGSGKTTQMPQFLVEAGILTPGRKIGCTQPRCIAAKSAAERVAEEYGCLLGQEVGYSIRFDNSTTPNTVIKYMSAGMLVSECLNDRDLQSYSVVMVDEAHERELHTDVLFGLLKAAVKKRDDLKLIVTSATLDAMKFSSYFHDARTFNIPGRTYSVSIEYLPRVCHDYVGQAIDMVMNIHRRQPKGDILVFLTGQDEIEQCCYELNERSKRLGSLESDLIVLPVYAALPSEQQTKIFKPTPTDARKVVVATNIAETSLTIDGIVYVIDSGLVKQSNYNARTGMESLTVTRISQGQAQQRSGRAGRTAAGKCNRLYTEQVYREQMPLVAIPEVQRSNLASIVLKLKAMGIDDVIKFDFMDRPDDATLLKAVEHLKVLTALDNQGALTPLGCQMANFPLEPVLSKLLITSVNHGCSDEIITIVAMLSEQNIFYRPKRKQEQANRKKAQFHEPEGDHLTLLTLYNTWCEEGARQNWCYDNFVNFRIMKRCQDIRQQLVGIMNRQNLAILSAGDDKRKVQKAIVDGFSHNLAKLGARHRYYTADGKETDLYLHPSSALFHSNPAAVVYTDVITTKKKFMKGVCVADTESMAGIRTSESHLDHDALLMQRLLQLKLRV